MLKRVNPASVYVEPPIKAVKGGKVLVLSTKTILLDFAILLFFNQKLERQIVFFAQEILILCKKQSKVKRLKVFY